MQNKKLIFSCIAGILLGYLAPHLTEVNKNTALTIGLIAGLVIGYALDAIDARKRGEKPDLFNKVHSPTRKQLIEEAQKKQKKNE